MSHYKAARDSEEHLRPPRRIDSLGSSIIPTPPQLIFPPSYTPQQAEKANQRRDAFKELLEKDRDLRRESQSPNRREPRGASKTPGRSPGPSSRTLAPEASPRRQIDTPRTTVMNRERADEGLIHLSDEVNKDLFDTDGKSLVELRQAILATREAADLVKSHYYDGTGRSAWGKMEQDGKLRIVFPPYDELEYRMEVADHIPLDPERLMNGTWTGIQVKECLQVARLAIVVALAAMFFNGDNEQALGWKVMRRRLFDKGLFNRYTKGILQSEKAIEELRTCTSAPVILYTAEQVLRGSKGSRATLGEGQVFRWYATMLFMLQFQFMCSKTRMTRLPPFWSPKLTSVEWAIAMPSDNVDREFTHQSSPVMASLAAGHMSRRARRIYNQARAFGIAQRSY